MQDKAGEVSLCSTAVERSAVDQVPALLGSTSAARDMSTDSNPYSQLPILPEISQSLSSTKIQRPQHAKGASMPVLSSVMLGGIMMGIDLVGNSITDRLQY